MMIMNVLNISYLGFWMSSVFLKLQDYFFFCNLNPVISKYYFMNDKFIEWSLCDYCFSDAIDILANVVGSLNEK